MIETMIYVKPFELDAIPEKNLPAKPSVLQKDSINCATYSLDHMYVAATHSSLHQILKQTMSPDATRDNVFFVLWSDFPKEFVRNSKSPTFIGEYNRKTHQTIEAVFFTDQ